MFEILTVLALYSRGSMQERLKILYFLYSTEDESLSDAEFEFLIGKVSTSLGSTLSIKKTLLHEIAEMYKAKLMPDAKDQGIDEATFIQIMAGVM